MIFHISHILFQNCIIKKGDVAIPYMAIATRTRSKAIQNSSNDKDFQDFLNTMVSSVNKNVTTSTSYTTSSSSSTSSSSYYWTPESPDSVVPGSTSSDDLSTSSASTIIYDVDNYAIDNNESDHYSLHGSSDIIQSLPGTTQDVNIDLEVSIVQFFKGLQCYHTFTRI